LIFGDPLLASSVYGGDSGEDGKSIIAVGFRTTRIHSCCVGWSCGNIGSCNLVRSVGVQIVGVFVCIPCGFFSERNGTECRISGGVVCWIDGLFRLIDGESL